MCVRRMSRQAASELAMGDGRILSLEFAGGTRVKRTWRDAVAKLSLVSDPGWPIPGPRTAEWCCRFLNRRSGGPTDWHHQFKTLYRLNKGDWGVEAHELAMRMLDRAGTFDGLDVCNLACLEDLLRQAQLVEFAYLQESDGGKGKSGGKGKFSIIDENAVFAGTHRETGNAMVAPDLLQYVGQEIERDANILKQIRKAREEKRLLNAGADGAGKK